MDINVKPEQLRKAAAAMDVANEQVKGANPCSYLSDIARGLPGGASARQVAPVVSKLDARFESWCGSATKQSEGYRGAARDYELSDQRAAEEGHRQGAALSPRPGLWTGAPTPGSGSASGPAIFRPGDPGDANVKRLIERLGGND